MIFKDGYGHFSARVQVKSGALTALPSMVWAAISTVLTISIYYVLLILTKENGEGLPVCFHTSTFGLLYLYTIVEMVVVFIILLVRINFIRFMEIASNRWNFMVSMGISTTTLVGRKVWSSIFALVRQYFFGYLLVIGCGFAFKLPFSVNYLLSLFFIGITLLILMCIVAMALAIFTKQISNARFMMLFSFCLIEFLMVFFKIYHKDVFQIDILVGLFKLNKFSFIVFSALLFIICYAVILLKTVQRVRFQELMPLDVFDIKPLISGDESELFTTDGARHTTIFDTNTLQDPPEYRVPAEKPRTVMYEDGTEGYQYKLLLVISIILAIISGVLLLVAISLPSLLLERIFTETLCNILDSKGSRILLVEMSAVFALFIIIFAILNRTSQKKRLQRYPR